ncbi:kelch domain-containing protein 3-like [Physella acuta]|uniref:kelch domain-containing protein 3-like n=1 Tax=Physella acuta TaxID=109671 RepID=UPI0027DE862F|nr:kelch domain-containing protein 3-like [Physella acuta]XP_059161104.1 kelch domain-containing protein 3-like [Physella acuta]XP_059161105.1 kelch domain-containing protein 3-like [Physella acuta]XP_059161106.1 kelch domain-containing protein 3-like [Physella acuta]XP_059161107.1 kelch domain-containing protein 3-like [Physella acuta]XP_059161108.1 kelch domain-containing protein 3-like [Physella acuta]XP_059161109.1 kelch domain-containing protein 3-like [Physella acuta]XP_059161110.1 kel
MLTWTIRLEGGPKRVNHAAVTIGKRIFSFGGYCTGEDYEKTRPMDVHVLNTVTLRWTLLPLPTNDEDLRNTPYQRYGHTAVEYEDCAYIWGGRNDSIGACNTLFRFREAILKWDKPDVTGPIPEARDGHSACIINRRMYIFAGYEEFTDRFSNDMNYFNFETFEWIPIVVNGKPARWRDFHTATAVGDIMYIFGGRCDVGGDQFTNNEIYCNKVMAFDTTSNTWSRPTPSPEGAPFGRRSHSAFEYRGSIYIFGGYNGRIECHFNDLHKLDLATMTWTKLNVTGTCPTPRRRQCASVVGTKVYFFGGTSPRLSSDKSDSPNQSDSDLIDRSDMYILDFEPTLKTLSSLVIIEHKLDRSCLPHDLRWELSIMTTDNNISRLHTTNG